MTYDQIAQQERERIEREERAKIEAEQRANEQNAQPIPLAEKPPAMSGRGSVKAPENTATITAQIVSSLAVMTVAELRQVQEFVNGIRRAAGHNAIGQGKAACGASPAPEGCAANGTNNERTEK